MKRYYKSIIAVVSMVMIISCIWLKQAHASSAQEDRIYTILTNTYGFSTAQASGILANIDAESGCIPTNVSGPSYGLIQWAGGRQQGLYQYARQNGMDASTIDAQLAYLYYELQNNEKGVYSSLTNCANTEDGAYAAAYNFCYYYERPKDKTGQSQKRGEKARAYYDRYAASDNMNGRIAAIDESTKDTSATHNTKKTKKKKSKWYSEGFYQLKLDMTVRAKASRNSKVLGTLKKGRKIRVKAVSHQKWGKISYYGKSSYISLRYAKKL